MKKFLKNCTKLILGFIPVAMLFLLFNFSCLNSKTEKPKEANTMSKPTITEVQKKYQNQIMDIPGVVGIGIGAEKGEQVIKVLVKQKNAEIMKQVPTELDGFKVIVEEVGEIKAL